jgi:small subunit ribosomal protein S6
MRRYELMLVLRPDTADDRVQQILDRTTRGIAGSEGQIVKVSPWGRRRLAYPISGYREGSYFIVVFDAPSEAIDELERGLNITEEIMRHLVTRLDRPAGRRGDKKDEDEADAEVVVAEGEVIVATDAEVVVAEGEVIVATDAEAVVAEVDVVIDDVVIDDVVIPPPPEEQEPEPEAEAEIVIDESESEAAPKAIG